MIIENIATYIPAYFYLTLIALSTLYGIGMIADLILTKRSCSETKRDLREIESSVSLHQGCNIENLPLISDIFDDSAPKLSQAYNEMLQTSSDLYQKKWIPNPKDFIHTRSIISPRMEKKLFGNGHLYYTLVGFILFIGTNIAAAFFLQQKEAISAGLILSCLPLLLALLFWLIFTIEKSKSVNTIQRALDKMIHTLSLKLPVFSENNGMAILVNQFIEYDHNMTSAVDKLTVKIDHFIVDGLTTAVSESIEKTLLESVSPSIERSSNALIALSEDIAQRENDGMKDLAVQFTSAVTAEMAYQFAPLVNKIQEVSTTLSNSKNYFDIITQSLESYKSNLSHLNTITTESLKSYDESKATFSNDIHSISQTFHEFSELSALYQNSAQKDIHEFHEITQTLYRSIDDNNKALKLVLDGITEETRNSKEQADRSHENLKNYLTTMDNQLTHLAEEADQKNRELLNGLSGIIENFLKQQSFDLDLHNQQIGTKYDALLNSVDESVKAIRRSAEQLKSGFDELEAARVREEERKNRSIFSRKRK